MDGISLSMIAEFPVLEHLSIDATETKNFTWDRG
jgi:hypothetical protein